MILVLNLYYIKFVPEQAEPISYRDWAAALRMSDLWKFFMLCLDAMLPATLP